MSAQTAIRAVGSAPATMMALPLATLTPREMMSPSPPAPMKVPMVVTPTATTSALRTPAMMTERARGSSTLRTVWSAVMPIPLAASRTWGGMPRMPAQVFLTMGSSE